MRLGEPLAPGRGQGLADVLPRLTLTSDVTPMDVAQGSVGDCWLLAAFSAFAEYRGAVEKLFSNTPGIDGLLADHSNMYTVTLYDLKTWTPVDIKVDERLCRQFVGLPPDFGRKVVGMLLGEGSRHSLWWLGPD